MSEWKEYRLSEIVDKFAMGPFGSNIKAENFTNSGVPVIRGTNLNYNKYVDGEFVFLTEEKAEELKSSFCYPGDLVFTHRGTIGQVGLIPYGKFPRYIISQSGMKLTVNPKLLDNNFLYYFFKSSIGQFELLKHESQVGVPSISSPLTALKSVKLRIPPLKGQKQITILLSALDDKIGLLQKQNRILESLTETIFRRWFIEEINKKVDAIVLGDYVSVVNGCSYKSSELNPSSNALITLKSFKRNGGFRIDGYKEFTGKINEKQIVKQGDLIVAHTDITQEAEIVGNPALVVANSRYKNLVISMDLVKVNCENSLLNIPFLYFLMRTPEFKSHCVGFTNGTTVLHMNKSAIPTFEFLKPDFRKVKLFEIETMSYLKKIFTNIHQIRALNSIRDILLPKLLSGEVTI